MKKKDSLLLSLPAELRTLIFQFALTSPLPLVTFRLDSYQLDSYTQATQPSLTSVSRQIRREALPIYYEVNDFILHTESPKTSDGLRWLRCNADYLRELRRLSFWVRYQGSGGQGAMSVSVRRKRKGDAWEVDGEWRWITVVRKPAELVGDVELVLGKLGELVEGISREEAGPEEYCAVMEGVREGYMKEKIS